MQAFKGFLTRLRADTRGTSLIEMTFIIPMLVGLGCAATDLSLCYARGLVLQQAAARTMEYAIAAGTKDTTFTSTLQNEAATAAGVTINNNPPTGQDVNPKVDLWLECDGVRQPDTSTTFQVFYSGTCSNSTPSRFASVTITDTYTWTFASLLNFASTVPLRGYAEVRIQ